MIAQKLVQHRFRYPRFPRGLGTPYGWYHHSSANFRLALWFSYCVLLEDFRGLWFGNGRYHPERFKTAVGPGCKSRCPNRDLFRSVGQYMSGYVHLTREWA